MTESYRKIFKKLKEKARNHKWKILGNFYMVNLNVHRDKAIDFKIHKKWILIQDYLSVFSTQIESNISSVPLIKYFILLLKSAGCRVCIEIGHNNTDCSVIDLYTIDNPQQYTNILEARIQEHYWTKGTNCKLRQLKAPTKISK